ncbi:uncharacterized protein LOC135694676 [Rhopilema esculentum]|uniref:uncharacterized protein LOC135694676 n=1 Tax=Rhopilema esculentum TaxID=499914 RepID=UPI0031CEA484|eukprot:gene4276-20473_t
MHYPNVYVLLLILGLALLLQRAGSWILRLPCKEEGVFDVASPGYALYNRLLSTLTASSLEDCFENCRITKRCKSVNFKESGEGNCELNTQTKGNGNLVDFKTKDSWTYYATNYNKKNIGSYCELFKPCRQSEYCIDTCSCPGFRCSDCSDKYKLNDELQCVVNIALNKPALLSTQYDQYTPATNAVDGSLEAVHRTCAITKHQSFPPWFRVDLQQTLPVRSVALQNRRDCCWHRMNPFDVRVGMSLENDGRVNPKCVDGASFIHGNQYLSLECPSIMYGRYVIVLAESSTIIELCELEVYS